MFGRRQTSNAVNLEKAREEEEEAKKEALKQERIAARKLALENLEYRYGHPINPKPAVPLKTPKAPPVRTPDEEKEHLEHDAKATRAIADDVSKYMGIMKNVSFFEEMGDEELEMAARALESYSFRAGEMIYDEGETHFEAWVVEEGIVYSSVLIPGIAGAGWEWKETRPYKPGKVACFGERGLRRGEPRPQRMVCLTDVKALKITQSSYVSCMRTREYKENLCAHPPHTAPPHRNRTHPHEFTHQHRPSRPRRRRMPAADQRICVCVRGRVGCGGRRRCGGASSCSSLLQAAWCAAV
jgi:hypothetical protein